MFNASFSKSNSSTRGTLHFTRQPRSCEVAPTLRQFHFQTLTSNIQVTVRHLYFTSDVLQVIRFQMLWISWQSAKSLFLLTSTINQGKFNKSMLHRAAKSLAEKTVLSISKKGASCVSFRDRLKLRELLRLVPWASEFEHHWAQHLGKAHLPKTMKSRSFPVGSYEFTLSNKNQSVFLLHRDCPCSMPAFQNLTHQPEAPFTSQGSQDLVKLLPHWGSFTFRP